ESLGIVLVHITPSGRGLRIVAIASRKTPLPSKGRGRGGASNIPANEEEDTHPTTGPIPEHSSPTRSLSPTRERRRDGEASEERGNLADNQLWLSSQLGVEPDAACKDAARCSFCPGFNDILFINKEKLFTYENPEYDQKFGPLYRGGHSEPLGSCNKNAAASAAGSHSVSSPADSTLGRAAGAPRAAMEQSTVSEDSKLLARLKEGYHGKTWKEITEQWFACNGGKPGVGDRHRTLLKLAGDLRYICDNDPQLLTRVLAESSVGREVADERGENELANIASSACTKQMWQSIPKRLTPVLEALGIQQPRPEDDGKPRAQAQIDYQAWWHRLEPLLADSPGFREACAPLPDEHKLAGVLAAGAMMGSYLTRCWWEHFDGKDYRLSFLVYIVGSAASGKSFVPQMDALLMAPMMASDRVGREWERQYKEEMKKRAASSKNAKAEAPEQQHPVIRYVPSTISNAMLYRRLTDAVDPSAIGPDGQPMHLHCYTCEAELATALRAQQGSWAGKLDLECKSFQNEVAGVDYANDQSVNGIIQVNWNQVVTGTPDAMSRKIRPSTVLDGLATRLVLFLMPSNDFAMIARRKAYRDHDRECFLRSVGLKLEQIKGELKAERLVDFCYQYEAQLAKDAALEEDLCLDYFRKRIPLIMMRYTLVRIVMRQLDKAIKGEPLEVTDSDLEFARLIGDWALMAQMHFFGQLVMDALENEKKSFVPRRRSWKIREAYKALPSELTPEILVENGLAKDVNRAGETLRRWGIDGLVKKTDKKTYVKQFKEIPE
ncbi:MAG: hypothetical protein K6G08_02255, partial [Prevotella sp.]|nr:hypothetical protein [Prevotella sp.]